MISFITAFKDFVGEDKKAQLSALYSWSAAGIPIVAPTNEPTVEENGSKFDNITLYKGVRTARDLRFENNSPIVKDLILKSLDYIDTDMVALINADIIITENFLEMLDKIVNQWGPQVFLAGTRYNLQIDYTVDSEESYKKALGEPRSIYNEYCSSDIFVMSKANMKKMAEEMPPYVLGRYAWDNWIMMYGEVNLNGDCYNCTQDLITLHCDHTHEHIEDQEGKPGKKALSSVHNLSLWRNTENRYGPAVRIKNWRYTNV